MNQKEFRAALLRGQGRCVLAVQKAPARYNRQVLWACGHPIAYDAQCEGSRAFYTYDMVRCYENRQPFLDTTCAALARAKSDGGWDIFYFAELLALFAQDGEPAAETALWQKYAGMYAALAARKQMPRSGFFPLRDDFETLCLAMLEMPGTAGPPEAAARKPFAGMPVGRERRAAPGRGPAAAAGADGVRDACRQRAEDPAAA